MQICKTIDCSKKWMQQNIRKPKIMNFRDIELEESSGDDGEVLAVLDKKGTSVSAYV
jgi:hypothetical protein